MQPTSPRICKISDCTDPHEARGWCVAHYNKWRRYGDPLGDAHTAFRYFLDHLDDRDGCTIWPYAPTGGRPGKRYGRVALPGTGKTESVHVLACIVAYGIAPKHLVASHGPCHEPLCFRPDHLSWQTHAENAADRLRDDTDMRGERSPHAVLTWAKVSEIRARYAAGGVTQRALAREYGVSQHTIMLIVTGRSWRRA